MGPYLGEMGRGGGAVVALSCLVLIACLAGRQSMKEVWEVQQGPRGPWNEEELSAIRFEALAQLRVQDQGQTALIRLPSHTTSLAVDDVSDYQALIRLPSRSAAVAPKARGGPQIDKLK